MKEYVKNKGFSLVEFTVYLALFSFISVLFLGVASRAQLKFMNVSSEQENLHRQTIALDLLKRDLMSASQYSTDWDLQQSVFKKLTLIDKNVPQSIGVSWFIGNQGLMRAQGEYDFVKHVWISRTSCIVCKSIKEISFVLECSGVWVVYKSTCSQASPFPPRSGSSEGQVVASDFAKATTDKTPGTAGQEQKIFEQKFFIKFRNRVVA